LHSSSTFAFNTYSLIFLPEILIWESNEMMETQALLSHQSAENIQADPQYITKEKLIPAIEGYL